MLFSMNPKDKDRKRIMNWEKQTNWKTIQHAAQEEILNRAAP